MAKATMLIEVTDQQIRTLQDAAGWASDYAQAAICDIALGGDGEDRRMDDAQRAIVARYLGHPSAARTECARVIADAQ